jgi:hypothetical protein
VSGEERRYGIHAIWALPEGSGAGICCECRTRTELILDTTDVADLAHTGLAEQSFTCDGCGTTHWFTLGALEARP